MSRGQAMVEFMLILPLFLFLLIAIIEFAFVFSTLNSLSFAARDITLLGAEGGDQQGTDCTMLDDLENVLGASSTTADISQVEIFWSDDNGNVALPGASNIYQRTGTLNCTTLKGAAVTLPYTLTAGGYPEIDRCTTIAGCDLMVPPHPALDTLGVRITYTYQWKTPLSILLQMAPELTFHADQQMRLEPEL